MVDRPPREPGHRGVPDPALGDVDDPARRDLVVGVGDDPQIGEEILDLPAVVEAGPTDHPVGDAQGGELLLHHPALRVGPVEDGDLPVGEPVVGVLAEGLAGDPRRLVPLVLRPVAGDGGAGLPVGPEVLGSPGRVVLDQGVGRVENGLGGAEVLLQRHDGHVGKRLLELQDVAHLGPTPAVDALVGVTHHAHVAMGAPEEPHELVLGPVGVLKLVDQDVREALLVVLEHVRTCLEEVDGDHQEVVEIHGVGGEETLLVVGVDATDAAPVGVALVERGRLEALEVDQLGLGLRDHGTDRARGQAFRIEAVLGHHQLDQSPRVGLVVDGERSAVPEAGGVGPQDAQAGRVERRHPHALGPAPDELGHPMAHLVGRLVGKGDGQDLPWRGVRRRHEVGDSPGEHPGLARAGAGDHEERATPMLDRSALEGRSGPRRAGRRPSRRPTSAAPHPPSPRRPRRGRRVPSDRPPRLPRPLSRRSSRPGWAGARARPGRPLPQGHRHRRRRRRPPPGPRPPGGRRQRACRATPFPDLGSLPFDGAGATGFDGAGATGAHVRHHPMDMCPTLTHDTDGLEHVGPRRVAHRKGEACRGRALNAPCPRPGRAATPCPRSGGRGRS